MNASRLLTLLGLLAGTIGLVVQFVISMQSYLADGRDIPGALGTFFTYYTILSNIVLVLIYLSEINAAPWLAIFRSPILRGTMVAVMLLVMTFVYFVLRHLSTLSGLFLVCDTILHYVTPSVYALWWLTSARHGALNWRDLPIMLAPTFVYFLYAMARGAWVGEYPYPILNAIKLGYPQVLLNAVYMTIGLGLLVAAVIGIDKLLSRKSLGTATP